MVNMQEAQRRGAPVACTLGEAELAKRSRTTIGELRQAVQETRELPNGYAARFPGDAAWCARLAEFVAFERACCPFLTFTLEFLPDAGPIWLRVEGPESAKELIRSMVAPVAREE
ncbi:MAG: hypothetical protein ACRDI2_08865 [Chloroflexota bacterium]